MTDLRRWRVFAGVLALLLALTICAGCARLKRRSADLEKGEAGAPEEAKTQESLYYDFEDILVPADLKLDKKRTLVYHAPHFTAGVLALSGRVEVNSLIRFFENNMVKDKWKVLSVFKAPRTIMFFDKANRSCIINVTEKQLKTEVEIWVAPGVEGG
ncbi:MAG: hypothetical protein HWN68_01775 [Desulfobacterales bacterium]|nr:hypothetical protein [Desulfobacterales bacterium]